MTAIRKRCQRSLDPDRSRVQVQVGAAQRGQLTPSQAAERGEQDQGAVARVDRGGQVEHLAHGDLRPFG